MGISRLSSLLRKSPTNSVRQFSNLCPNPQTQTQLSKDIRTICQILSTNSSNPKVSTLLDPINIKPSEPLVAEVLRNITNSGFLALSFFTWAQNRTGFKHTTETYNALIDSLGKIRQFRKIWDLVEEMKTKKLLTKDTFALISRRYVRAKKVNEAVDTFFKMEKSFGFKLELSDFNRLLDTLCKSKCVERAQKVFDEMRERRRFDPDIKSYTILLEGWSQRSNLLRLDEVCREMRADAGFELDAVAHGIVIKAHVKAGNYEKALEIFRAAGDPTQHAYCSLITGLGSARRLDEAVGLFLRAKEAYGAHLDAPTYNSLVGAYCWSGRFAEAERVVGEMGRVGLGPNARTFDIMIHHLVKNGRSDEALEAFDRMGREFGLGPAASTYEIVVRMLVDAGRVGTAGRVWDRMRSEGLVPGLNLFSTVIAGLCRREGKLDDACRYFEEMLGLGIRPPGKLLGDLKNVLIENGREDLVGVITEKVEKLRKCPLLASQGN